MNVQKFRDNDDAGDNRQKQRQRQRQ